LLVGVFALHVVGLGFVDTVFHPAWPWRHPYRDKIWQASCYSVSQLRPLVLCIQGLSLGYRSVSALAKGEAEGLIYKTRLSLKGGLKLPPLRVMGANHHGKKDTRCLDAGGSPAIKHLREAHPLPAHICLWQARNEPMMLE